LLQLFIDARHEHRGVEKWLAADSQSPGLELFTKARQVVVLHRGLFLGSESMRLAGDAPRDLNSVG